jgi:integrase
MPAIAFPRFTSEVEELYQSESAPATYRKMRQTLREFAQTEGLKRTSDMTDVSIVRWKKAHMGRGCWTVRSLLISWRRACNIAIAKGYLRHSPFQIRSLDDWAQTVEPGSIKHHSLESIGTVLAHLQARSSDSWEDQRLHALASTVAFTGVRAGEAIHAKVEDFDLANGVLVISNRRKLKTRASAQPVPIPPGLTDLITFWLARTGCEWAFPGLLRVGPWSGGIPGRKPLDRLKDRALEVGVPGFTFQSLRHSWATHAEGPWGLTDPQIQRNLRHTTMRTSKAHYRHPDLANLREIGSKVSFPIPAPLPS